MLVAKASPALWAKRQLSRPSSYRSFSKSLSGRRKCFPFLTMGRRCIGADSLFLYRSNKFDVSCQERTFADSSTSRRFSTNAKDHDESDCTDGTDAVQETLVLERSTASATSCQASEELLQETARLRRILDVSAEHGDDQAIESLSTTSFEEYDRLLEEWSKTACDTAMAQFSGIDSAKQAESVLVSLEQNMDSDREFGKHLVPDTALYNKVLHTYAMCSGGREAALCAQSILERMLTRCRDFGEAPDVVKLKPPEPTVRSFNIVINAWAKSGAQDSGSRAEEVFTIMEEWEHECKERYESIYVGEGANSRSLSGVVDAWAQTKSREAAERVMIILEHAIDKRRKHVLTQQQNDLVVDGTVIKPNVIVFNSAIHVWVNSGQGHHGAEEAEKLLGMLEKLNESKELGEEDTNDAEDVGLKPNTRTLSLILDAWAQCDDPSGTAAMYAQEVLDRMETLYNEGHDVKPNYVTFTTCIKAWSRSRNVPDAAYRAEALLDRLLHMYKTTGDKDLKPTSYTGNAVITAWARSRHPESAHRAKAVLRKLEKFSRTDSYSYNSVIDAYAKKGDARNAKQVLDRMELAFKDGNEDVRPDLVTYNSVLNAMAKGGYKRGEASRAEDFLAKMEERHRSGMTEIQPDLRSYTSVIDCWAHCNHPWQGVNAYRVLKRMLKCYQAGNETAKPDAFAFGRVINACARTRWENGKQRRSALTTALRAFEELQQSPEFGEPQSRTYGTLLMACSLLASNYNEWESLLEAVFQQCCATGNVNNSILTQVHRTMPNRLRERLLGPGLQSVPPEWSRNVPDRDRPS